MKLKKFVISIMFAYIYLILFLVVPLDFNATLPNDISLVSGDIILDGVTQNESIYSVSVLSMPYVTPFSLLVYQANNKVSVNQNTIYDNSITFGEAILQGQISKQASVELSLIHSFSMASNFDDSIYIDYLYQGLVLYYRDPKFSNLAIGNLIVSVNDISGDYELMLNEFRSNDTVRLLISSTNLTEVTITKSSSDLFYFYPKHEILSSNPTYSLPVLSRLVGGPSAGAMQTLSLYIDLLNIKVDQIIVGTGTIEYNGSIGLIGGLRQKVYTAIREGVSYFFLPSAMLSQVSDLASLINLVPINTIGEAVTRIYEISN